MSPIKNVLLALCTLPLLLFCATGIPSNGAGDRAFAVIGAGTIQMGKTTFSRSFRIDELEGAIGKADRKLELKNDIYVWDDRGVYAYANRGERFIHEISFDLREHSYKFSPRKAFQGRLKIGERVFTPASTHADLPAEKTCVGGPNFCMWAERPFVVFARTGKDTRINRLAISLNRWQVTDL